MSKIVKTKFIKNFWFNIIQTDNGFHIFNTQRKRNQADRVGIGFIVPDSECKTLAEAVKLLNNLEQTINTD